VKRNKQGITLVELLVTIGILLILAAPLIDTLRSGADTSLRGLVKIETTLEARTILHQVQLDIKAACFVGKSATTPPEQLTPDMLIRTIDGATFEFHRFTTQEKTSDHALNPTLTERIPVRTVKVLYLLERPAGASGNLLTFTRRELYPPGHPQHDKFPQGRSTFLSKNVNFFHIEPRVFPASRGYSNHDANHPFNQQVFFQVSLQLAQIFKSDRAVPGGPEETWKQSSKNLVIADFFDTVSCEYYHQLLNRYPEIPNWYHDIRE
jgi:hypothetical protein